MTIGKNLGKYLHSVFLGLVALALALLVLYQYGMMDRFFPPASVKEGATNGNGYYITTHAKVSNDGQTIITTMDTNGYFEVKTSTQSTYNKNASA